jgi:opacity protein-like surface antigen
VLATGNLLFSQEPAPLKPLRFDLSAFIGYRTSITFTSQTTNTTGTEVILDANPSFGASFGFRINEEDLVEFRWARQDTRVHPQSIASQPNERVILDEYHGDFTHEYVLENWRPWARPYVMASVGATHIADTKSAFDFTRFSFGIGAGVKFYPTRHLGFKIQGEWLPIWVDPQATVICGGGCIAHIGGTLSNQGEFVVGPILRF